MNLNGRTYLRDYILFISFQYHLRSLIKHIFATYSCCCFTHLFQYMYNEINMLFIYILFFYFPQWFNEFKNGRITEIIVLCNILLCEWVNIIVLLYNTFYGNSREIENVSYNKNIKTGDSIPKQSKGSLPQEQTKQKNDF